MRVSKYDSSVTFSNYNWMYFEQSKIIAKNKSTKQIPTKTNEVIEPNLNINYRLIDGVPP